MTRAGAGAGVAVAAGAGAGVGAAAARVIAWVAVVALFVAALARPAHAFERERSPEGRTRLWRDAPPLPVLASEGSLGWVTDRELVELVREAATTWERSSHGVARFDEATDRPFSPRGTVQIVTTGWTHGATEVAYTSVELERRPDGSYAAARYRIELNGSIDGFCARCRERDRVPLDRVLLHEWGHVLGLAHSLDRRAIMAPSFVVPEHGGEPLSLELADDDRQGLAALYPGPTPLENRGSPVFLALTNEGRWTKAALVFVWLSLGLAAVLQRVWRSKKASVVVVAR
jgi:hypothetical protein